MFQNRLKMMKIKKIGMFINLQALFLINLNHSLKYQNVFQQFKVKICNHLIHTKISPKVKNTNIPCYRLEPEIFLY